MSAKEARRRPRDGDTEGDNARSAEPSLARHLEARPSSPRAIQGRAGRATRGRHAWHGGTFREVERHAQHVLPCEREEGTLLIAFFAFTLAAAIAGLILLVMASWA